MTSFLDAALACARQTALEQRARLLDAVWDDVQGERRAIQCGALPACLFADTPPAPATLERYAADLLYCPDGIWRVARDHVGDHPGASLLEAPVLAAFLPCLCRLLLGETLKLPSLPAWWLGEPESWRRLAADGRRFSIRDGLDPDSHPVFLADMPLARRHWLQTSVDAAPSRFVAGLGLIERSATQRVIYDTKRGELALYC